MPIPTREVKIVNGRYPCPECASKYPGKFALGEHRFKQHGIPNDWKKVAHSKGKKKSKQAGKLLTSEIQKRSGLFHCPECGESFPERRYLGRHRTKHGIEATGIQARCRKLAKLKKLEGAQQNGKQPAGQTPTAQLVSSNGRGRPKKAAHWNEESITGFIFAHVHTLIENACAGREDIVPNITQRLSDLLHLEVSGKKAGQGHLGLLRGLS